MLCNMRYSIPILISTVDIEGVLDTLLFPVSVFPLNDSPDNFSIFAELWEAPGEPLDPLAFYYPCDGQDEDCTEFIHGAEFGRGDNFFTLHNDPSSAEASIAYDSRFDSGKLLFKWNRSYDPDADPLISEYFTPDLYYRVEKILNQYSLITNLKDKLPKNTSKIEIQKKIFKNIFLDKKKIGVHPRYISLKKKYKPNIAEIDDMTKLNETIYNLLN